MNVAHLMTKKVVTVTPETAVADVAKLLVERRLSAVPVVDGERHVIGIISEGDLMRRPETGTEAREPWWFRMFAAPETLAQHYVKSHGLKARDVMTAPVATIDAGAPVAEAVRIMEEKRVKRLPVLREGTLAGIIARADLVRALAAARPQIATEEDDFVIRERLEAALDQQKWAPMNDIYVTVIEHRAYLWGSVRSDTQAEAAEILARGVPGVRSVESHLAVEPSAIRGPLLIP